MHESICTHVYMYICVYIYVYTYTYIHIYIDIHIHMHVFMYARTSVCMYVYKCTCKYTHMYVYVYMHIQVYINFALDDLILYEKRLVNQKKLRCIVRYTKDSKIWKHIYCNTLQHTATHCNTLQHTATHCNIWMRCDQFRFWRAHFFFRIIWKETYLSLWVISKETYLLSFERYT